MLPTISPILQVCSTVSFWSDVGFLFVLNLVSSDSDASSSGEDEGKDTKSLPSSLNLSSCSATSSAEQTNIVEQAFPGQDANLLIKRLEDEQVNFI